MMMDEGSEAAVSQEEQNERLNDIIRMNYERVFRIAYSRVHNREDALDITQDAFLMFVRKYEAQAYSDTSNDRKMNSLLTCIVLRRVANFKRNVARRQNHEDLYDNEPSEPSVEEEVFGRIDTGLIRECIQELPERYASYLYLATELRMPPETIADVLEVKPDSLRSIASRARRMLKSLCEGKGVGVNLPEKHKKS